MVRAELTSVRHGGAPPGYRDWFRPGHVTSSRPMRFGPRTSARTAQKGMCLFAFARNAGMVAQKAGLLRVSQEGEST